MTSTHEPGQAPEQGEIPPIVIDIFSDVICPWCLIGRQRLRKALLELDDDQPVALRWLPYELNPDMPKEGMDRKEYLDKKFGGVEAAREVYDRIREAGAAEGIEFNFADVDRTPSTFDAHRLMMYASSQGKADGLKDRLFRAYFLEGSDVGNRDVLLAAAKDAELDAAEAQEVLDGDKFGSDVREIESFAQMIGVQGVPFFVFNGKVGVSGAHSRLRSCSRPCRKRSPTTRPAVMPARTPRDPTRTPDPRGRRAVIRRLPLPYGRRPRRGPGSRS